MKIGKEEKIIAVRDSEYQVTNLDFISFESAVKASNEEPELAFGIVADRAYKIADDLISE